SVRFGCDVPRTVLLQIPIVEFGADGVMQLDVLGDAVPVGTVGRLAGLQDRPELTDNLVRPAGVELLALTPPAGVLLAERLGCVSLDTRLVFGAPLLNAVQTTRSQLRIDRGGQLVPFGPTGIGLGLGLVL